MVSPMVAHPVATGIGAATRVILRENLSHHEVIGVRMEVARHPEFNGEGEARFERLPERLFKLHDR